MSGLVGLTQVLSDHPANHPQTFMHLALPRFFPFIPFNLLNNARQRIHRRPLSSLPSQKQPPKQRQAMASSASVPSQSQSLSMGNFDLVRQFDLCPGPASASASASTSTSGCNLTSASGAHAGTGAGAGAGAGGDSGFGGLTVRKYRSRRTGLSVVVLDQPRPIVHCTIAFPTESVRLLSFILLWPMKGLKKG